MKQDIPPERVQPLYEQGSEEGDLVIYWMQRAQRTEYNHALEYAIHRGNELDIPVVVVFCLVDNFKDANLRHYQFMLEGLQGVEKDLRDRGITLVVKHSDPVECVSELSEEASEVIVDKAYLPQTRDWRRELMGKIDAPLIDVETDLVIPIEEASSKEEYAARTIRPKIDKQLEKYLIPVKEREVKHPSLGICFDTVDLDKILGRFDIDKSVEPVAHGIGGTEKAKEQLQYFIDEKLSDYPDISNDPSKDCLSNMSPYLHFGQISPIYIALKVKEKGGYGVDEYLEQLMIRRELAFNFVYYNKDHDNIDCLPGWASKTLEEHENDEREYVYSEEEFEKGDTHDEYWNAAQKEMLKTGKIHGYMRMYWGKKILEWSERPADAYQIALHLNNKYELDGRDPNGYAGVAWCFGKHDQAWKERNIYGKVRYMNANGLKRKFDIDRYVEQVDLL